MVQLSINVRRCRASPNFHGPRGEDNRIECDVRNEVNPLLAKGILEYASQLKDTLRLATHICGSS